MPIIPSIDLLNGTTVQLVGGDAGQQKVDAGRRDNCSFIMATQGLKINL